jgi:hypothetical protein
MNLHLGGSQPPLCRQCQAPGEIPIAHPEVPPDTWVCSADCALALGLALHEQRKAPALAPAVHLLRAGLPICGFSRVVPADWPDGHTWTGYPDEVTCPQCKTILGLQ